MRICRWKYNRIWRQRPKIVLIILISIICFWMILKEIVEREPPKERILDKSQMLFKFNESRERNVNISKRSAKISERSAKIPERSTKISETNAKISKTKAKIHKTNEKISVKDMNKVIDSAVLNSVLKNQSFSRSQLCNHPYLDPYDPAVMKFFRDVGTLKCDETKNWIKVDNGTFWITKKAKARHGKISCQYFPIYRKDENNFMVGSRQTFSEGIVNAPADIVKITCQSEVSGYNYSNIHITVSYNKTVHARVNKASYDKLYMPLNVLMYGFDSVSRNTWLRVLPKTHKYFTEELGGIVLKGYNIVGDGTPQALLPILTGQTEVELPEARRGKPGAKVVDDHPWIWKEFKKAGYMTQYGEDMHWIGTFHYRMLGFEKQPVDHYWRPYSQSTKPIEKYSKPYCLGSEARHKVMMDWVKHGFQMYRNRLKFIFAFHSEYSHEDTSRLKWADDDFLEMLKYLKNNFLNNTVLILMSDHGARFHKIRESIQGKYEERMPYFSFRFPKWFPEKYPLEFKAFKENSGRLTTPFDIHETFLDMMKFEKKETKTEKLPRGMSLFRPIPKHRTCSDADISPHWCACLGWNVTSSDDLITQKAANSIVKFMNNLTATVRAKCQELSLKSIKNSLVLQSNPYIARYLGSADTDGRVPKESNDAIDGSALYQITLQTTPGDGIFETTVKYNAKGDKFIVSGQEISRINKYGNTSNCIHKDMPHLDRYCSCKIV
ncbi:uncharacterized protein LOC133202384 [Saccostrea echinata]|uniref:uncharacterized protein LOC133202384 n=1 Tax=Saccostrea echinata TaxID=191078 RepID=UPI002A7FA988|nr:uncharacterized protein LOC133202384 [Saccostrea echinata]